MAAAAVVAGVERLPAASTQHQSGMAAARPWVSRPGPAPRGRGGAAGRMCLWPSMSSGQRLRGAAGSPGQGNFASSWSRALLHPPARHGPPPNPTPPCVRTPSQVPAQLAGACQAVPRSSAVLHQVRRRCVVLPVMLAWQWSEGPTDSWQCLRIKHHYPPLGARGSCFYITCALSCMAWPRHGIALTQHENPSVSPNHAHVLLPCTALPCRFQEVMPNSNVGARRRAWSMHSMGQSGVA